MSGGGALVGGGACFPLSIELVLFPIYKFLNFDEYPKVISLSVLTVF